MKNLAAIAAIALTLATPAAANAAPATVQLRVEGSSQTIFEGPVATDGKTIDGHPCDGTNGGFNPTPGPTMTSALDDAASGGAFSWDRTYFDGFDDFGVDRIGPDATDFVNFRFWGYALNYAATSVGGCQQQVASADEVLFGYDFFSKAHLLRLAGPNKVSTGSPLPVAVTDGGSGDPIDGAEVGGQATDAAGNATISFGAPGVYRLKAERTDSLRSNVLEVCVSDLGTDECTTFVPSAGPGAVTVKDSSAPTASIAGIRNGAKLRRGPRLLQGKASDTDSGLKVVKLSLRRHRGGDCSWWSASAERFSGGSCKRKVFFAIGNKQQWSYQLAKALGPGHYVLDVKAVDSAGNAAASFVRGSSRIVFDVLGGTRSAHASKRKASGARTDVMVAGESNEEITSQTVRARAVTVRASGKRCRVAASTPLAALIAALGEGRSEVSIKDFGACSRRSARDSGQLFVRSVLGDANEGADGWVYKLRDRIPSLGGADLQARIKSGDGLSWFYCVHDSAGHCQPTLKVEAPRSVSPGSPINLRVLKVDDEGHTTPAAGATVVGPGGGTLTVAGDGTLVVHVASAARIYFAATLPGAVPSIARPVTVGVPFA